MGYVGLRHGLCCHMQIWHSTEGIAHPCGSSKSSTDTAPRVDLLSLLPISLRRGEGLDTKEAEKFPPELGDELEPWSDTMPDGNL